MTELVVIDKNQALLPSQDFAFLRAQGLAYIQGLSGQIWTDHNDHDPGITILEALCYALTDLGYRTGFDLKDLLAPATGSTDPPDVSGLFPAHEVLTTAPLTILDYRKLLLKIEGVRNAWLDPMTDPSQTSNYGESEVPIYADCLAGGLSNKPINAFNNANPRVWLNGLYRVRLELDVDDRLGSLNEARLVYQVRRGKLKGLVIALDSQDPAFQSGAIDFGPDFTKVTVLGPVTPAGKQFKAQVDIQLADSSTRSLANLRLRVVNDHPRPNAVPVPVTSTDIADVLKDDGPEGLIPLFWEKQQARKRSIEKTWCVLHAHRNLCEEVLSVETVSAEHVAVCADFEVRGDADIEDVQARVMYAIEEYLNPPVRYYTLKEMLDAGLGTDQIFDGPYVQESFRCGNEPVFTKPGFVKTEELAQTELRRFVYVSDIINILIDPVAFPEILTVKNVLLRKYDADGVPIGASEQWCLEITPGRQPVLDIERSKVLFYKHEIPYLAKTTEFQKTLDHLRAMARKRAYVAPNQVLPMPTGRYRDPAHFFTIQHDFPRTYGIGKAGLPGEASAARVAQARQLKAYLTFFDQVLADYLAQLANVRRLFSLDKTLRQTYFSQYLNTIAGVREAFEDEFYLDKAALQDDVKRNRLIEDEGLFLARRNRMLDHLMARFAEQFTDYALMMFTLEGDPLKTGRELITDKIDFLREYPVVGRERGKACNIKPESPADIWDTDNVAGLEKRVSRLLGIADYNRRDLACDRLLSVLFAAQADGNKFRLVIPDAAGSALFRSAEKFGNANQALAAGAKLYPFIRSEGAYVVDDSSGAGSVFFTVSGGGVTLRHSTDFDTEADAVQSIRRIIDRYDEILLTDAACEEEGFHLIEHILLRPFVPTDELIDVCLDPSCESCGDEDPYSFRITVVLPYWPKRFRNLQFHEFFERTLREEAPAHVQARICWVDNAQMAQLDLAYRAWLEQRAKADIVQNDLSAAVKNLIRILRELKTVYPAATLHDCLEGEGENPVRLGSTSLGIF